MRRSSLSYSSGSPRCRRPLGLWRDRRKRDPDQRRHHSRGSWRGYWLRHDGGPDNLQGIRAAIEIPVPHGRTSHGGVVRSRQPRKQLWHAGNRQSLHRGLPSRIGYRLVHAAQRVVRSRQPDRELLHRPGEKGHEEVLYQPMAKLLMLLIVLVRDKEVRSSNLGARPIPDTSCHIF